MGHEKVMWTADEIRKLRYRMGWSQAEFAHHLHLDLDTIVAWENGKFEPEACHCSELVKILRQVEDYAEKLHRQPIAEVMMRDHGLSQIHDLEVDGVTEVSREKPNSDATA